MKDEGKKKVKKKTIGRNSYKSVNENVKKINKQKTEKKNNKQKT